MEKATTRSPKDEADFKMSEMIPGTLNFFSLSLPCSLFPRQRPRSTAAVDRPSTACFCLWSSLLVSLLQTLDGAQAGGRDDAF